MILLFVLTDNITPYVVLVNSEFKEFKEIENHDLDGHSIHSVQFDGDNETISKLRYKIIKALESRSEIEKITIFDIKHSKVDSKEGASKCSDI